MIFNLALTFGAIRVSGAENKTANSINSKKENSQNIHAALNIMYQSPFDKVESFADPMMVYDLGLTYNLSSRYFVGVRTRFYNLMLSKADEPRSNGFLNTDLLYVDKNIWSYPAKDLTLSYSVGVTLPTSETSRIAGLRAGPWGNIILTKKAGTIGFTLTNQVGVNNFAYETADIGGEEYNESHYWFTTVSAGMSFDSKKQFNGVLTGTHYTSWDVKGNGQRIYSLSAILNYMPTRNFGIVSMLGTQDQRSENYNLFLYDRMFWMLGIVVSI